jgi:hypothetical protein
VISRNTQKISRRVGLALKLFIAASFAVIASCSEPPVATSIDSISKSTGGDYDASKGFSYVEPRPAVSAFLIDEAMFKINGAQVGIQDYLDFETPVVSYFLPLSADYVEILRCPTTVSLVSRDGTLLNIEAGSKNSDDLSDSLRETNFWLQAEESGQCTLVASEYNISSVFHDESAPNKAMFYLVRACVEPARLADTKLIGKRNCSLQLAITLDLEGYKNERSQNLIQAVEDSSIEKMKMDQLGRDIYNSTVELNNAIYNCAKEEADRKVKLARKQAITNLIGLGISVGSSIYTAPAGMGAKDLFKSIWASKDDVAGRAANIGSTLSDLTSDPSDFPKSCTEEKKLVTNIYAITQEFKLSHEKYADLLDSVGR